MTTETLSLNHPVLTHVGGPTALFEYAGHTWLTDPTFDAPGDYPLPGNRALSKLVGPALNPEDLPRIDAVLLSHDQHADNLDDAGRQVLARAGAAFGTVEAAARLTGLRGLEPWQATVLNGPADGGGTAAGNDVTITAVPALHGPDGAQAMTGTVTGFVLESDGWPTVYVSGDNASVALVEQIARRFPGISIALVFAGAARTALFDGTPLTLTSAAVAEVALLLPDALIIPLHTEGWAHFTEGTEVIEREFAAAGLQHRLLLPQHGKPQPILRPEA